MGYESDEDLDNGFRPPGLIRLSTTVGNTPQYVPGFGNLEFVVDGTTTHHLTMYRAASGALVFGAGTIQWTWGLDEVHDAPGTPPPADPRMQQAQVNLLADMGAQPTTLMAGLTPAAASTDTVGPSVAITSGADGAQPNGARVTIEGTAQDAGGGEVAGVEVSTDKGATWHPANGTTSWTYTYTQHGYGARAVRVRAVDDSANIGKFRARHPQVTCPCSIFGDEVPAIAAHDDTDGYELGLRFVPMRDGAVNGVRFYKGAGNGGAHVGRLWTAGGVLLDQAPFTAETATGWQSVSFTNPINVQKGQAYVVSYTAPQGRYSMKYDAFELSGVEADPLSVPGGFAAGPDESGVFGPPGSFPSQSPSGRGQRTANYYVDVLFNASGPPDGPPTLVVTDHQPAPGATGAASTAAVSVGFSAPVEPGYSLTLRNGPNPVTGSVAASEGGRRLTFTPSSPLPPQTQLTVDLTDVTSVDGIDLAPHSWSFTTGASGAANPPNPGGPPNARQTATLFGKKSPRGTPTGNRGVEVGIEFSPTRAGEVVALRYFQVPGRSAPKSVTLWSAGGDKLATAKVKKKGSKPKKAGWRTVVLDEPVALHAGRSYVASYYVPSGRAARTPDFFKKKVWKSGPLRAKKSDNGRYLISSKSRFPKRVARGVNFFADVRFDYP